jgi:hypothetical protein
MRNAQKITFSLHHFATTRKKSLAKIQGKQLNEKLVFPSILL